MSAQLKWTTSPTVTSNSLETPTWEMNSSVRPSRHAANQSTSNFDHTLWPVEQTIKQTMRPLPTRQSRQPQQPLQSAEHTQKQSRPRQPSAQRSQPTQQIRPSSRSHPRQPRSSLLFQENLTKTRRHSRLSPPRRLPHEMTNQRSNNCEHFVGPSLPASKHLLDGVQKSRQSRPQPQQTSDQRVRQSQQTPNRNFDCPLQPTNPVSNHQASTSSRQQIPRSAQQIPAGGPPLLRCHSDKSSGSESTSSIESYIKLSPARRREIIISVNDTVQYVMASMLSDKASNMQWKLKLRKKDISYYMDETDVKPGQTRFCCVSHTHATVDEIMKLFVVSDAESMARNTRVLSDNLLETKVLSVLRQPTKQRPMNSMYVQYTCYRSPGLMVDREVCIAVATDMIHQPDGSTIGYCLWDTVEGPEFAEATNKLEPCIMFRSGFFLRRSGRRRHSTTDCPNQSYTKIVYMAGLKSSGWAPVFTTRLLMEKFGTTLTRLCSYFRRKKLDSRTFVMKSQWTPKMSAKSCKECTKQLQVLSNRVNCHACGHVVCRSCVSKELVELHAVGLVSMHICFSCLEKAGLPARISSQKPRLSLGRRRLKSDTTSALQVATQQPLSQPQPYRQSRSLVDNGLVENEDDEDSDTGEWVFTPSGVPVRPYRMDCEYQCQ